MTAGPSSAEQHSNTGDRELMLTTVELARKCESETGKISPKVAALLVRDGVVLAAAFRGEFLAGEHAEYSLLERKLRDATVAGATLFTTLEPCTSRNQPKIPCADRIVERRIRRVVIGILDPNPQICGEGELRLRDAGVEIGRFDSDLMAVIEELNRDFIRDQRPRPRLARNPAQREEPSDPGHIGPNGHRVGYNDRGDKVEWIPDDETPDREWPLLLRLNDGAILETYNEFWDKIWWNRHQVRKEKEGAGRPIPEENLKLWEQAEEASRRIEAKYGRENLGWDDFEWGLLSGRMSALAWVMGAEWDESLDT